MKSKIYKAKKLKQNTIHQLLKWNTHSQSNWILLTKNKILNLDIK